MDYELKEEAKLRSGKWLVPTTLYYTKDRIFLSFPFDRELMTFVKGMERPKWHGYDAKPLKMWSVALTDRNLWWLRYLKGDDPFALYNQEYVPFTPNRNNLYSHQIHLIRQALTVRCCIWGAEMGAGKTLAAIELMEQLKEKYDLLDEECAWVGTKASLRSTQLEFEEWRSQVWPELYTYDRLRIEIIKNGNMIRVPKVLIIDELAQAKNATSGRSKALKALTDAMRDTWDTIHIVGLVGAPAPKSPPDWWHQCEVVQPGFLKESNSGALQRRLAVTAQELSLQGQVFPKMLGWLDGRDICVHTWTINYGVDGEGREIKLTKTCGEPSDSPIHDRKLAIIDGEDYHPHVQGENEVAKLYRRLKGLVEIKLKKDCLELPDKITRLFCFDGEWKETKNPEEFAFRPPDNIVRAAQHILETSPRVITALIGLRELADGFQYRVEKTDKLIPCRGCGGKGKQSGVVYDGGTEKEEVTLDCTVCNGSGETTETVREAKLFDCPKDDLLKERLSLHEEYGRFVVCADFQASLDKIRKICNGEGWFVIQTDSRGWHTYRPDGTKVTGLRDIDMLRAFAKGGGDNIVFVGHPGTMGRSLNLQASAELLWYSLPHNGDNYIQATDRIHRPGLDVNRGCTISYAFLLGVDLKTYLSLLGKLRLQSLTMGMLL